MATIRTTLVPTLAVLAALVALVALACAGGASQKSLATGLPIPEDLVPASWNQQRVAAIAAELADAVEGLRDAVRASPVGKTLGSGQENAMLRLTDKLRLLRSETRLLANELESGSGREATRPVYERVGLLARDAREDARKMFLPEQVLEKITHAGEVWSRLTPYYLGV